MRIRIAVIALVCAISVASRAGAAVVTREVLKTYFETGDVPTEQQFATLIDSYIHQTDDGLTLYGIGAVQTPGASTFDAIRVGRNVGVNEMLPYTTLHLNAVIMETNWFNQEGYLPLVYEDSATQPHYGYLHIIGGSPPGGVAPIGAPVQFPIYVDTWSWESTASTTLFTPSDPEPASAGMLLVCAVVASLRRRRFI